MTRIPPESFLASIPIAMAWKDKQSYYLAGTQYGAELVGLESIEQLVGLQDADLPNGLTEHAAHFIKQDKEVMLTNEPSDYLELFNYAEGPLTVLSKKAPLRSSNQTVIGTCCVLQELGSCFQQFAYYLLQRHKKKNLSYQLYRHKKNALMTPREMEVLTYLLHGKTIRDIASILVRSMRTIESHFNALKSKFQVSSKSQLIEAAIQAGYFSIIPDWMFREELTKLLQDS